MLGTGSEFLCYKINRGKRLFLPAILRSDAWLASRWLTPTRLSNRSSSFPNDEERHCTKRRVPLATEQLIEALNPLLRGWGEYYKRAHVRKLFNQLDRWIVRRIWSHRFKRWRNCGWKQLPTATLFGEYGLVNLVGLIPSLRPRTRRVFVKDVWGKLHARFGRRTVASIET